MADTVVLPRPAEAPLGTSPSLRLTPQDPTGRKSIFHEEVTSVNANGVGQPDRHARELASQLPLKEQVNFFCMQFGMNQLTRELSRFPFWRALTFGVLLLCLIEVSLRSRQPMVPTAQEGNGSRTALQ